MSGDHIRGQSVAQKLFLYCGEVCKRTETSKTTASPAKTGSDHLPGTQAEVGTLRCSVVRNSTGAGPLGILAPQAKKNISLGSTIDDIFFSIFWDSENNGVVSVCMYSYRRGGR